MLENYWYIRMDKLFDDKQIKHEKKQERAKKREKERREEEKGKNGARISKYLALGWDLKNSTKRLEKKNYNCTL